MILTPDFKHEDLLKLAPNRLPQLASEVREEIIRVTFQNGGHLASSLCAVDLIIALLRRFDPVRDRILFDVGHQAYAYKLLTDRRARFETLRLKNGISGFPRRSESPCDAFDTGHSSTSISAALGYARARDLLGEKRHVIAFIGDAALINGLALEALNYVEETGTKLIIVLNDNKHSIGRRVGGFSTMLARLSANTAYNKVKSAIKTVSRTGALRRGLEGIHAQIKNLVKPENMFDDLGINYWGPFDGHDIKSAELIFELAKGYERPVLLHFSTVKGKGFAPAEDDPTSYHQVAPHTPVPGRTTDVKPGAKGSSETRKSWSEAASIIMEELAVKDPKIVCFTAAMSTGVKLEHFRKHFPERFYDVGIAESHMLTMAAGLAAGGARPWVFIYATFLQRAMDQLVHDIALQNLPVVLMVDRAGLVGSDGETHQGVLDIPWGRAIPNLEIFAPSDEFSLREVMNYAAGRNGPTLVRYPRGTLCASVSCETDAACTGQRPGARVLLPGECSPGTKGWALLAHGVATHIALDTGKLAVQRGLPEPRVIDLQCLKPLNSPVLESVLRECAVVAVCEENYLAGGVGEEIAARIAQRPASIGSSVPVLRRFGVPDVFVHHALPDEQREDFGLTAQNILRTCAPLVRQMGTFEREIQSE